jgi:hypothetical protein
VLELITLVIVLQCELNLGILCLEFEIDKQVSCVLVYSILHSKYIGAVDILQPHVCFFKIVDVLEGALAPNPII